MVRIPVPAARVEQGLAVVQARSPLGGAAALGSVEQLAPAGGDAARANRGATAGGAVGRLAVQDVAARSPGDVPLQGRVLQGLL